MLFFHLFTRIVSFVSIKLTFFLSYHFVVPSTITDTQLSQKLGQTFGCPVRLAKQEFFFNNLLLQIEYCYVENRRYVPTCDGVLFRFFLTEYGHLILFCSLSLFQSQFFSLKVRRSSRQDADHNRYVITLIPRNHNKLFLICFIIIDSVSNLQHAFKVYAQMHLHDPLLALLLFLDLDTSSNLSSRPTGVASSSATSAIPSSSASVPDFADSAFRRVTETRKGSSKYFHIEFPRHKNC